jgi:hypothetical protein
MLKESMDLFQLEVILWTLCKIILFASVVSHFLAGHKYLCFNAFVAY